MRKSKKTLFTGFGVALLLVLGFAIFFKMSFRTVVVSGISMEPTFKDKQRVLVSQAYWLIGAIKNKDVVLISDDNEDGYIIKRVYRMAGEVVDWANAPESWPVTSGEFVVPEGQVYVIGDNRPHSEDSRAFGPVDLSRVLGKVVIRP